MPNGKTSYSMKWEEQFGWLRKAKKPDGTIPSVYNKTCRSDGGGLTEVKAHQKSKSYREKESTEPNQRAFVIGAKESINLSSNKVSLTTKKTYSESWTSASIEVCGLKLFARFRVTFHDSGIAKNYNEGATKINI